MQSLPDLLEQLWTQDVHRRVTLEKAVVQWAAEKTLADPGYSRVLVDGYDRYIHVPPNLEIRPESLADPGPTENQKLAAIQVRRDHVADVELLAHKPGKAIVQPPSADGVELTLKVWRLADEYPTFGNQLALAHVPVEIERHEGPLLETTPWEFAAAEFLKSTQLSNCNERALRHYAELLRRDDLPRSVPLSVEVARMDQNGFGDVLADRVERKFPGCLVKLGFVTKSPPVKPDIAVDDQHTARTLEQIAEFAEEHFGHRPNVRSIQNWRDDSSLRMYQRGKLSVFSKSDLEALVRK